MMRPTAMMALLVILVLASMATTTTATASESGLSDHPLRSTPADKLADRLGGTRLFRPWPQEVRARGEFEFTYFTDGEVEKQETDFSLLEYKFNFEFPLFLSDSDELLFSFNYDTMSIDTQARLPRADQDEDFPDALSDLGFSFTYRRDFYDDWSGGLNFRVASASDELFGSDATVLSLTGFLRVPDSIDGNSWLFYVNYANRRTERDLAAFNTSADIDGWPIPGFGYEATWNLDNWVLLGLPYSAVHFEPGEWLVIDFSYHLPREVHARLTYPLTDRIEFYGSFDWQGRVFFRADRLYEEDRLVLYDKKVAAGMFYRWNDNICLELELGRSFHRFAYEEETYAERKDNWFEMEDAIFLTFDLKISF
jgi:hypothetical protein